jgi:TPR repeat protein
MGLDRLSRKDEVNKRDYWIYRTDNNLLSFYFHRAESGQAHGQYELGKMYLNGWDKHSPDLQMAKYWLGKSAEQGYSRAVKIIESMI